MMRFALVAAAVVSLSLGCATSAEEKERVVIRFEGLQTIDADDLEDAADRELETFAENRGKGLADLADATYAMESWLRRKGHAHSFVDFEVLPDEADPREVVFRVDEGPRVRRTALAFEGVTVHDEARIRPFFQPPPSGLFGTVEDPPVFRERDVDAGIGDLESLYLQDGYFTVRIADPEITYSDDRAEASVLVRVEEGPRHVVGSLDVVGALPAGFELDRAPLEEILGGPYRARTPAEAAAVVRRQLEARGWLRARIRPQAEVDPATARAAVVVRVEPGPQIIARAVEIDGLDRTSEGFIRGLVESEIDLDEVLTQKRIDRARELLLGSGLFRVARIELRVEGEEEERARREAELAERRERRRERLEAARRSGRGEIAEAETRPAVEETGAEPSPDEAAATRPRRLDGADDDDEIVEAEREAVEHRDAVVEVLLEEIEARRVAFEAGFGSYELLRGGVRYTDLNLFGIGRELDVDLSASLKSYDLDVRLSDPWIFGRDDVVELGARYEYRQEPSFERTRIATDLTLRHRFSSSTTLRTGYFFEAERAEDVTLADDPGFEGNDFVTSAGLFARLIRDKRDDPFVPTSGYRLETGVIWSSPYLGADLSYVALALGASGYIALGEDTVLGATFRIETRPILDDRATLPIQERLFVGGDRSVRSFTQDQLGPKDAEGDPLGGLTAFAGTVELRQRLWRDLHGAAFWDVGTVGEDAFDVAGPYGHAFGLGLRYYTPIGPIRLDFGYNPFETFGEDAWAIHFALGFSF